MVIAMGRGAWWNGQAVGSFFCHVIDNPIWAGPHVGACGCWWSWRDAGVFSYYLRDYPSRPDANFGARMATGYTEDTQVPYTVI